MAIIKCPECGKEVSTRAEECPHCGYPLQLDKNSESKPQLNKVKPNRNRVFGISSLVILLIGFGVCWSLGLFSKILPALSMGNDDVVEITQSFTEAVHQYDELYPFSEGLAAVKKDGKFGYIDTKGNLVIPCQFGYASDFIDGTAIAAVDSEKSLCVLKSDGQITETKYIFYSPTAMGTIGTYCTYLEKESTHPYKDIYSFESLNSEGEEVTMFINKNLQKVDKPTNISPRVFEKDNMYTVYTSTEKNIYGDDVELKGLKSNDGKIVIHAKYNYLELGDNGVALASIFVEDAESHQRQYEPHGFTVYGYIDMDGNSTFTDTDLKKIEAYKQEQLIKKEYLERIAAEEQRRLEEERRQKELEARGPEWLQGSWECKGTVDYGRYLGGVQRFTARVIITSTNLKVYYDGDLAYSGSYEIEGGEIKYNRKNGSCDVIPLDYSNERLEFGDGKYYSKISSSSNYQSYSSNSYNYSFRTANDVLSYTSSKSFYNSGDRLQIKFDAVYLNGRALTGAPRVTDFSSTSATVVANSPYGGGGALHFYVNSSNGTVTQNGDVYRER